MANARTFGRRNGPQAQSWATKRAVTVAAPVAVAARAGAEPAIPVVADSPPARREPDFADIELENWKKARRFQIPWRPLYLMASLCFGIGSFVLPGSINSNVDYLLYALAAASFYAGMKKRREKKAAS